MCKKPVSLNLALIKVMGDTILIPWFFNIFEISECGIIGHAFESMTRLAFICRDLIDGERPLMLIFVFSE